MSEAVLLALAEVIKNVESLRRDVESGDKVNREEISAWLGEILFCVNEIHRNASERDQAHAELQHAIQEAPHDDSEGPGDAPALRRPR